MSLSLPAEEVEDKARDILEVPSEAEVRMWQRFMTNSYELLKNPEQTLADAGIYGGQVWVSGIISIRPWLII